MIARESRCEEARKNQGNQEGTACQEHQHTHSLIRRHTVLRDIPSTCVNRCPHGRFDAFKLCYGSLTLCTPASRNPDLVAEASFGRRTRSVLQSCGMYK